MLTALTSFIGVEAMNHYKIALQFRVLMMIMLVLTILWNGFAPFFAVILIFLAILYMCLTVFRRRPEPLYSRIGSQSEPPKSVAHNLQPAPHFMGERPQQRSESFSRTIYNIPHRG